MDSNVFTFFTLIIFSFLIGFLLFLLLRAFVLWYYKVPQILKNQQQTNVLLERIADSLERGTATNTPISEFASRPRAGEFEDEMPAPSQTIPSASSASQPRASLHNPLRQQQ